MNIFSLVSPLSKGTNPMSLYNNKMLMRRKALKIKGYFGAFQLPRDDRLHWSSAPAVKRVSISLSPFCHSIIHQLRHSLSYCQLDQASKDASYQRATHQQNLTLFTLLSYTTLTAFGFISTSIATAPRLHLDLFKGRIGWGRGLGTALIVLRDKRCKWWLYWWVVRQALIIVSATIYYSVSAVPLPLIACQAKVNIDASRKVTFRRPRDPLWLRLAAIDLMGTPEGKQRLDASGCVKRDRRDGI